MYTKYAAYKTEEKQEAHNWSQLFIRGRIRLVNTRPGLRSSNAFNGGGSSTGSISSL
jgi:hypothetical protein